MVDCLQVANQEVVQLVVVDVLPQGILACYHLSSIKTHMSIDWVSSDEYQVNEYQGHTSD